MGGYLEPSPPRRVPPILLLVLSYSVLNMNFDVFCYISAYIDTGVVERELIRSTVPPLGAMCSLAGTDSRAHGETGVKGLSP